MYSALGNSPALLPATSAPTETLRKIEWAGCLMPHANVTQHKVLIVSPCIILGSTHSTLSLSNLKHQPPREAARYQLDSQDGLSSQLEGWCVNTREQLSYNCAVRGKHEHITVFHSFFGPRGRYLGWCSFPSSSKYLHFLCASVLCVRKSAGLCLARTRQVTS